MDQLRRLGLRPLVVLLDLASFGGALGSKALAAKLTALSVPNVDVSEGDPLTELIGQLNQRQTLTKLVN